MREIKFRAWDGKIINDVYCNDIQPWFNEDFTVQDGYVIEQYTGIRDKDEKYIFEGDIVQPYPDNKSNIRHKPFVVEYGEQWYADDAYSINALGYNLETDVPYTVIGNIHENLELLK